MNVIGYPIKVITAYWLLGLNLAVGS